MAVEQTQILPAPVLEGALTAFTKKLIPLIRNKITAVYVSKYLKNVTSKIYLFNNKIVIPNFLSISEYIMEVCSYLKNK